MAVGVGSVRGSAGKRLRPGGSTSPRPRAGGPAAPAARCERGGSCGRGPRLPRRVVVVRRGRAAVDVEAVLDGKVLDVAEPGIDAAQGLVGTRVGVDVGFAGKAAPLCGLDDEPCQSLAPLAVEPIGLRVFV